MAITNKIVTRGMGMSRGVVGRAGLVTQGFGGPPSFVVTAIERAVDRRIRYGSSSKRKDEDLETFVLWAKLIEVNSSPPKKPIEGSIRISVDRNSLTVLAEHVASRVSKLWNDIKVSAKRIK